MLDSDIENGDRVRNGEKQGHLVRVWKVPVPLRHGHVVSDTVKNIAIFMTAA